MGLLLFMRHGIFDRGHSLFALLKLSAEVNKLFCEYHAIQAKQFDYLAGQHSHSI